MQMTVSPTCRPIPLRARALMLPLTMPAYAWVVGRLLTGRGSGLARLAAAGRL